MTHHAIMESKLPNLSPDKTGWPWNEFTDPAIYSNSKTWPKISIITPSYNQGDFIEETIRSILLQNYPNLEYIIIDGGSRDNTRLILEEYSNFITYWVSEKDRGQSNAINKGLAKVTGEIFNWINSDDFLEPGALLEVASTFMENPDALAVGGFCRLFDKVKQTSTISRISINGGTEENIINFWMNQPSTFYKTEVINEFGGLNESLNFCMDVEIWFKFLSRYGISNLKLTNHLLSHFRHHEESKSEKLSNSFLLENKILLLQICNELKLPAELCQPFNVANNYYNANMKWNVTAINKEKFKIALAKKYHHYFFELKNYPALRHTLLILFKSGKLQCNRYFLSLFIKALIKC